MKIETLTSSGQAVEGAECRLTNDKGEALARSGQSVSVRRSGGNMSVQCIQPGQPSAEGQAVSRVNGGMVGNVLVGGLIGAAIDAGNGAGFNYPSWMQLVFGEQRYFDRNSQQGDQPLAGVVLGTTQMAIAAPAAAVESARAIAVPTKELGNANEGGRPAIPETVSQIRASPPPPSAPAPSSTSRVSLDDLNALLPGKQ